MRLHSIYVARCPRCRRECESQSGEMKCDACGEAFTVVWPAPGGAK